MYRFGDSFVTSGINDQTHYNKMYNKAGLVYENTTLGKFQFFVDDFRSNYNYNQVIIFDNDIIIPGTLSQNINSVGGQYDYQKKKHNYVATQTINILLKDISKYDVSFFDSHIDHSIEPVVFENLLRQFPFF